MSAMLAIPKREFFELPVILSSTAANMAAKLVNVYSSHIMFANKVRLFYLKQEFQFETGIYYILSPFIYSKNSSFICGSFSAY